LNQRKIEENNRCSDKKEETSFLKKYMLQNKCHVELSKTLLGFFNGSLAKEKIFEPSKSKYAVTPLDTWSNICLKLSNPIDRIFFALVKTQNGYGRGDS
jgi:hypothetical protein